MREVDAEAGVGLSLLLRDSLVGFCICLVLLFRTERGVVNCAAIALHN
jgi:hypothetical protein